MRQLLPVPADIDPVAAHAAAARPQPPDRPWLALNMVASLDGATAIEGVSGGLGAPADKEVFRAIRAVADVIIVAAGTVRAERYGPPRTSPAVQAARSARGQAAYPRMVIVTRSLELDHSSAVFAEAPEPPLVITSDAAPHERRRALEPVAEVRSVGAVDVDLAALAGLLASLGARVGVVEGGPSLNGQLAAAGLLDEVNLSLSPMLVGGHSRRVAEGPDATAARMELAHLWEGDGLLFGRYVRAN